jgi:uncharacterized repeat protein (TIGR04138 family)
MLCEKCGQNEATQTFMFGLRGINLCDACHARMLEGFERMRKVAERYGTVTRIPSLNEIIQRIIAKDSRFGSEPYEFVAEAMREAFCSWPLGEDFTTLTDIKSKIPKDKDGLAKMASKLRIPTKHLIDAFCKLASKKFGKRTIAIFSSWGVTKWSDFGEIVGRMQKANGPFFDALKFSKKDFERAGDFKNKFPSTDRR